MGYPFSHQLASPCRDQKIAHFSLLHGAPTYERNCRRQEGLFVLS